MNNKTSFYKPLDVNKSEIRLIEVIANDQVDSQQDLVRCRLHVVSLDESPSFHALSYIWGDPNITTDILVSTVDDDDGESSLFQRFPVTTNLASALRSIDHQGMRIWADAISINQTDLKERATQVQIMGRIYKTAKLVVAWLGESSEISLGLASLGTVASEIKHHSRKGRKFHDDFFTFTWLLRCRSLFPFSWEPQRHPAWLAMTDILLHLYWSRMWIFQEAVLAQKLVLTGANRSLVWDDLGLVLTTFNRFRSCQVRKPEWMSLVMWQESILVFGLSTPTTADLVAKMRYVLKYPDIVGEPEWHVWDLGLLAGQALQATDPKDHVYALLGVCNLSIMPDYSDSKSVSDVYREFTEKWLEAHRRKARTAPSVTLDPLSFLVLAGIGLSGSEEGFSSWAPNFPRTRDAASITTLFGRADHGVFEFKNDTYACVRNKSLFVTGVQIDFVASTTDFQDLEPQEVHIRLRACMADFMSRHPTYVSGSAPLQPFVRLLTSLEWAEEISPEQVLYSLALLAALVPDVGSNVSARELLALPSSPPATDPEPDHYFSEWFLRRFFKETDLDLESLENLMGLEGGLLPLLDDPLEGPLGRSYIGISSMLKEMHTNKWKLFETAAGYVGFANQGLRAGDSICILNGCGVPAVLRKDVNHFVHVGTAKIVGLMDDGQAAEVVKSKGLVLETFEIR